MRSVWFQDIGCWPSITKSEAPVLLREGALIELRNDPPRNANMSSFAIDCDLHLLESANKEERMGAFMAFDDILCKVGNVAAYDEGGVMYHLEEEVLRCSRLVVSTKVLDMLLRILHKDVDRLVEQQKRPDEPVELGHDTTLFTIDVFDRLLHHPREVVDLPQVKKLAELLTTLALKFNVTSKFLDALRTKNSPLYQPTADAVMKVITAYRTTSETHLRSAAQFFSGSHINNKDEFSNILADCLEYSMAGGCSTEKVLILLAVIERCIGGDDDLSCPLSQNTSFLESLLQVSCFHDDPDVKARATRCWAAVGTPKVLSTLKPDGPALKWWVSRCLPTWVDMIFHQCMIDTASSNLLRNVVLGSVGASLATLVKAATLTAPDMPTMSLFAMELVDGGGYEKLKAIPVPKFRRERPRDERVIEICDSIENTRSGVSKLKLLEIVPWSWKTHPRFPQGERMAVCALFSSALYKHPRSGESTHLPGEVAHEICTYLPIRSYHVRDFAKSFGFARDSGSSKITLKDGVSNSAAFNKGFSGSCSRGTGAPMVFGFGPKK